GKVIAVVGQNCAVAQQLADHVVVTSGLLATPEVGQTVEAIMSQLGRQKLPRWQSLAQRLTGIALALEMAREGDVVVVSGTGHTGPGGDGADRTEEEGLMIRTLIETIVERKAA